MTFSMDAPIFLKSMTVVLCVAAVTTIVFQRLKQPVVLGYILAGLIVGPHVPVPLVADTSIVHALSELGVILLMFGLGLEFSLGKLVRVGPTAAITAIIECGLMICFGFMAGRAFGWTAHESIFVGGIVAISSTTIIAKAFQEQNITGKLREVVMSILIVEDLVAILLMAFLTGIFASTSGEGGASDFSTSTLFAPAIRLALFLAAFLIIGLFTVPRAVRAVSRFGRSETLLVTSVGLCFGGALLAQKFGYSVALGAFIAGSLVAESGEEKKIETLIEPVRDMFAAIFFISVGMLIEPQMVVRHWFPIFALTLVVIAGKIISASTGAFLTGSGTRTSLRAGFSLAQIGEFSFIIAALGLSLKVLDDSFYSVAVAVSAITTLTTPWLLRASGPFANFVDRKLPRSLQTFAALYGSWIEQIRSSPHRKTAGTVARRLVKLLLVDTVCLIGMVIAATVYAGRIMNFLSARLHFSDVLSRISVIGGLAVVAAPFVIGVFGIARRLGLTLAESALPKTASGQTDLAAAPRKALVASLQLAVVLIVGGPLLALTQPLLPGVSGTVALVFLLAITGLLFVAFWRGATNLQGHVRAGSQMLIEALASQTQSTGPESGGGDMALVQKIQKILPGLGEPTALKLTAASPAVGKTLARLNLRGLTGATVLAIVRNGRGITTSTAHEVLQPGDMLALAGTQEAVDMAKAVFEPPANP
jgi:CPA2 family monovalent cation:H+ antiporter-2